MIENLKLSADTLFEGKLFCYQNKEGYRFSLDSILLAHFCLHWKKAVVLDLGCGCGILGLLLLFRSPERILSIHGVELQKSLYELTKKNIQLNKLSTKFTVQHGDYISAKKLFPAESFSHVICNPPFYKHGSGRTNLNSEEHLARHQTRTTVRDIAAGIAFSLKNKGNAALIYPSDRLIEIFSELVRFRLQPKRVRFVYGYPEKKSANLALFECKKNGGEGLDVLPPLYIYKNKNDYYSEEVERMFQFEDK